jgi:hypothetical protein
MVSAFSFVRIGLPEALRAGRFKFAGDCVLNELLKWLSNPDQIAQQRAKLRTK